MLEALGSILVRDAGALPAVLCGDVHLLGGGQKSGFKWQLWSRWKFVGKLNWVYS